MDRVGGLDMRHVKFGMIALIALGFFTTIGNAAESDAPVALVEKIENAPNAKIKFLDYVYAGQKINLGSSGIMTLSFMSICTIENHTGGVVTITADGGESDGGSVKAKLAACQGTPIEVADDNSESGATVTRVTPFQGQDWSEWTIKSDHPTFKWPDSGKVNLSILDMDTETPTVLWKSKVTGGHVDYPADAPKLQIGIPYEARVVDSDGKLIKTAFSFDPDFEASNKFLSSIVPIGRK